MVVSGFRLLTPRSWGGVYLLQLVPRHPSGEITVWLCRDTGIESVYHLSGWKSVSIMVQWCRFSFVPCAILRKPTREQSTVRYSKWSDLIFSYFPVRTGMSCPTELKPFRVLSLGRIVRHKRSQSWTSRIIFPSSTTLFVHELDLTTFDVWVLFTWGRCYLV